jgi:hypothetical protein
MSRIDASGRLMSRAVSQVLDWRRSGIGYRRLYSLVSILELLLPELHQAEVSWTEGLSQPQKATLLRRIGQLQGHLRTNPGQPRP